MSTHYETLASDLYPLALGVEPPAEPLARLLWPRQAGVFVRAEIGRAHV